MHQLTTHMSTLIMWYNRFSENEKEAVEAHIPRHPDSKTKKPRHWEMETINPRHRDSKTFFQKTKSHDVEIPRLKNHDIEIPRPKTATSRSCGILTLMPPDSLKTFDIVSSSCTWFSINKYLLKGSAPANILYWCKYTCDKKWKIV